MLLQISAWGAVVNWPHLHIVKGPLLLFNIKPVSWSCSHRCAHLCVPNQQPPHTSLLHSPVPSVFARGHSAFIQLKPAIPFLWRSASGITGPAGSQTWGPEWVALPPSLVGFVSPGLIHCSHCCQQLRDRVGKALLWELFQALPDVLRKATHTFLLERFRGAQQGEGTRQLCSAIPHPLGSCESRHSCPGSLGRAIPCAALSRDSDSQLPSGDTAASAGQSCCRRVPRGAAAELHPASKQSCAYTQVHIYIPI